MGDAHHTLRDLALARVPVQPDPHQSRVAGADRVRAQPVPDVRGARRGAAQRVAACQEELGGGLRRQAALDALGVPTGVVSNHETANLLAKLERSGLGGRFDVVLCPSEGGLPAKPHPRAFLAGCEPLGTDPATTAYVGDRLRTDAVGARDAGLVGVWLDRRGRAREVPEGVVRIRGLAELPALVAAGAPGGSLRAEAG